MVNQQMSGRGNFWGRLLRIRCGEERLESGVYGSPSHAGWVSPVWDGLPYMQLSALRSTFRRGDLGEIP